MVESGGLWHSVSFSGYMKFYGQLINWSSFCERSLKDTDTLAELALCFGRRHCWKRACSGWVEPVRNLWSSAYQPYHLISSAGHAASPIHGLRTVWGWNFCVMYCTTNFPWQLQRFSNHFGYDSTGKLVRLNSFTVIQGPFSLSDLALWIIITNK